MAIIDQLLSLPKNLIEVLQQIKNELVAIHQTYKTREEHGPNQPITRAILSRSEADKHQEETRHKETNRLQKANILVQFGALIITGIIAVATFLNARAAKDQAAATWANAKMAEQNIQATVNSFREDQRAWVSPHIIHQIFAKDQPLVVPTQFDNTGKTPALYVRTCEVTEFVPNARQNVKIDCPDSKKSSGFDIIFPAGHLTRMPNATGRGGLTNIDPEGLLRSPLMEELRHGNKSLYVYGRVDYRDVFNRPHWSTFCSTMVILPPTPGGLPETVNWMSCENGNAIDTEH